MAVDAQPQLEQFLRAHRLAERGEPAQWNVLTAGVSSELWRVDLPGRSICIKRALPKLKVAADWQAPLSRNDFEWQWLCFAAEHRPDTAPRPLAHDKQAGLFAMSFLPPEQYPVWKTQLMEGMVDPRTAARVGDVLAALHSASAHRADVAREFDSLENFHALRIEPYLLATAQRHSDVAERLQELARLTAATNIALVHGDVSPKNILVGARGPVLLDAECAWYGDPAFDVAFCLNHLLLKCLVRGDRVPALLESFAQLTEAYFVGARFEARALLEARAANLLPALMLARVDGKSPVEYLADRPAAQDKVRRAARSLLKSPADRLAAVADAWSWELEQRRGSS